MVTGEKALQKHKMDAFAERFLGDSAAAVRAGLNYIGDRLGIFKTMAGSGPLTVAELAERSGLDQRYLQEWLAAMVSAQYIEYDADKKTYELPGEHAVFLADENSPMFMGGALQMPVPLVSSAPKILEAFRNGGGLSHDDHHPEMTEATERFTRPFFNSFLTQEWIPSMPELERKLHEGVELCDIGCGSGQAALAMARAYPKSRIFGFDNHAPSIERATENARKAGLSNVQFECRNAETAKDKGRFYLITTFDVIHDMADPIAGLKSIKEMLHDDGTYMMLEMNVSGELHENIHPLGSLLYSISTLYCMTVSLAENGAGIGACMGENKAKELTKEAGFTRFRKLPVEHPMSVIYEILK